MKIRIQKVPAFVLENRFFDKLTNPKDVAVYAYTQRMNGIAYTNEHIMEQFGLSEDDLYETYLRLVEIGYLTPDSTN